MKRLLLACLIIKFCVVQAQTQLNHPLIHLLDSLINEDQKWRALWRMHNNHELDAAVDTLSVEAIARHMTIADSLDYYIAKDLFGKYGFLNYDLVGKEGSINFWALVQHQEKHPDFEDCVLEQMKIAVDEGKAPGENYAMLADRVAVLYGRKQIYGTQMVYNADSTAYIPSPIAEPEHVNERRKSMGMGTLESYIAYFSKRFWGGLKKRD